MKNKPITYRAAYLISDGDRLPLTGPEHAALSGADLLAEARAEMGRVGLGGEDCPWRGVEPQILAGSITLTHPVTHQVQAFDLSAVDRAWLDARVDRMDDTLREQADAQGLCEPAEFFTRYAALDPEGAAALAWAS